MDTGDVLGGLNLLWNLPVQFDVSTQDAFCCSPVKVDKNLSLS